MRCILVLIIIGLLVWGCSDRRMHAPPWYTHQEMAQDHLACLGESRTVFAGSAPPAYVAPEVNSGTGSFGSGISQGLVTGTTAIGQMNAVPRVDYDWQWYSACMSARGYREE